jgi:hypothetical protein
VCTIADGKEPVTVWQISLDARKRQTKLQLSEMPLVRQHRIRVSSFRRPPLLDLSLSVRGHGRGLDATHVRDLVDHLCVLPDD